MADILVPEWAAAQEEFLALKRLGDELKGQDVALVLHHKQPSKEVAQVIAASGAKLVVVDTDPQDTLVGLKASVEQVVGALVSGNT